MPSFFYGSGRQYKDPSWRWRGRRAYMRFYDPVMHPSQKEVALGTSSKTTAETRFHELKREYMLGRYDPWRDHASRQMALETAIERYVSDSHIRPGTRKSRACRLAPFERENPGLFVSGVSAEIVHAYCFRDGLKQSTQMRYLSEFRQFLDFCRKRGWVQVNRAVEVMDDLPRDSRRVLRDIKPFLSEKQFGQLLRAIDYDLETRPSVWGRAVLRDVFIFAVTTGLRRGELCNLKWRDVLLEIPAKKTSSGSVRYGWLLIRGDGDYRPKTGHEDSIPLNRAAYEVLIRRKQLCEYDSNRYVFTSPKRLGRLDLDWVSKCFLEYRRLAILPDGVTFHTLRHTHASWHAEAGTEIRAIQLLLRHSSLRYTEQYAHLSPSALAEKASVAMDHLDFSGT